MPNEILLNNLSTNQNGSAVHTTEGAMLKKAFMIGPSKAVMQKGTVEVKLYDDTSDEQGLDFDTDTNTDTNNSSYIRNNKYSIFEAYSNMNFLNIRSLINEADDNSQQNQTNNNTDNSQQNQNNTDDTDKDNFKMGSFTYMITVKLPNEGFTNWYITFDKRINNADIENVLKLIKGKKFKQALQVATNAINTEGDNTEKDDGFIVYSAETYIYDKSIVKYPPSFIGHCRYAFDSGSTEQEDDNSGTTVCLAVAPINAYTTKPDDRTVIQTIYRVIGGVENFTGGTVGKLGAATKGATVDMIRGDGERQREDDTTEQTASNVLSNFIHKKFTHYIGDQNNYADFLAIKKFIKEQCTKGNLKIEGFKLGDDMFNSLTAIGNKFKNINNQLIFY